MATELRSRGLRNPRHDFLVSVNSQQLSPLFACPVRPRETVVGFRLDLDISLSEAVKFAWAPNVDIELGIWKVPISSLGEYFADLFVADFEDSGGGNISTPGPLGSGVQVASSTVAFDGPLNPSALQNRTRLWAGELGGQSDAAVRDNTRVYSPYVSASTFHVARSYYEMELEQGLGERQSTDLWQNPPIISSRVKGMTQGAIGANLHDDQIPTGGVAEWAERLSLLSRRNRTYAEYLQGFGVPLSRVRSMPEPLMIKRMQLQKDYRTTSPVAAIMQGSAAIPPPATSPGNISYTGYNVRRMDELGGTPPVSYVSFQDSGAGMMHLSVDLTRKRRLIIDEPSIILGTILVYDMSPNQRLFDQVMDITRLISGSLWGDNNSDEIDFITSQQLPGGMNTNRSFGAGIANFPATNGGYSALNADGQAGPFVMNALNLMLNGDRFSNDPWAFRFLPQFAGLIPPVDASTLESLQQRQFQDVSRSLQLTAVGRYQHGVATELVS